MGIYSKYRQLLLARKLLHSKKLMAAWIHGMSVTVYQRTNWNGIGFPNEDSRHDDSRQRGLWQITNARGESSATDHCTIATANCLIKQNEAERTCLRLTACMWTFFKNEMQIWTGEHHCKERCTFIAAVPDTLHIPIGCVLEELCSTYITVTLLHQGDPRPLVLVKLFRTAASLCWGHPRSYTPRCRWFGYHSFIEWPDVVAGSRSVWGMSRSGNWSRAGQVAAFRPHKSNRSAIFNESLPEWIHPPAMHSMEKHTSQVKYLKWWGKGGGQKYGVFKSFTVPEALF